MFIKVKKLRQNRIIEKAMMKLKRKVLQKIPPVLLKGRRYSSFDVFLVSRVISLDLFLQLPVKPKHSGLALFVNNKHQKCQDYGKNGILKMHLGFASTLEILPL